MKKHILSLFFSVTLLSVSIPASSQDFLVDFTFLGSRTKIEMFPSLLVFVNYDIHLYKIRYKTLDVHMQPDTASGLLVVPQVPPTTKLPLVVYAHGTTSGPDDVPSKLRGGYEVAMGYAGFGFATIAPDYLGLGDSRGFHPYLHAETEASASLDMIFAAHEFLENNDPDLNPEFLFLAGYSQGGHVSMALHRELEKDWIFSFPVTAATHMSGPYSMAGIMRDRILSDESYGFPSYFAYVFLGFNEAYGFYDDIGQVFKEPYATSIRSFYANEITLPQLNGQLISTLVATGDTVVKKMLHDSIVFVLENDPTHPLNLSLSENDTYDWAPVAPTRLYYCGMDTQVPPRNSIIADSVMNALGAEDVRAINLNPTYDHGPCVFLAILNSKNFFQTFLTASSAKDFNPAGDLKLFPNPSSDEIYLDWEVAKNGVIYQIINAGGVIVQEGHTITNKITLKEIPSGLYIIKCTSGNSTKTARIYHK